MRVVHAPPAHASIEAHSFLTLDSLSSTVVALRVLWALLDDLPLHPFSAIFDTLGNLIELDIAQVDFLLNIDFSQLSLTGVTLLLVSFEINFLLSRSGNSRPPVMHQVSDDVRSASGLITGRGVASPALHGRLVDDGEVLEGLADAVLQVIALPNGEE